MAYDVVPLCDMEMIEEKSVTLVYSPWLTWKKKIFEKFLIRLRFLKTTQLFERNKIPLTTITTAVVDFFSNFF